MFHVLNESSQCSMCYDWPDSVATATRSRIAYVHRAQTIYGYGHGYGHGQVHAYAYAYVKYNSSTLAHSFPSLSHSPSSTLPHPCCPFSVPRPPTPQRPPDHTATP